MREAVKYKLANYIRPGDSFHLRRVHITSEHSVAPHYHDYAEILWVESGSAWHETNGERFELTRGSLVVLRPQDYHYFIPTSDDFTIVNLAFEYSILVFIRGRYFPKSTIYYWTTAPYPHTIHLNERDLKRASAMADKTMRYEANNIQLDLLLLNLLKLMVKPKEQPIPSFLPIWLTNAIQLYTKPEHFQQGVDGFVELCRHNRDYVNRVVKKHLKKTVTELANERKMHYAAGQLEITSMPIKEICLNCGFRNLSHFYKLFSGYYGQTPQQYREMKGRGKTSS